MGQTRVHLLPRGPRNSWEEDETQAKTKPRRNQNEKLRFCIPRRSHPRDWPSCPLRHRPSLQTLCTTVVSKPEIPRKHTVALKPEIPHQHVVVLKPEMPPKHIVVSKPEIPHKHICISISLSLSISLSPLTQVVLASPTRSPPREDHNDRLSRP